jgi:Dyp-type peroxidase family
MSASRPVLEAPAAPLLALRAADRKRQNEPNLDVDQIQGNIFPGFSKDFQTLLFLNINDPVAFAGWLGRLLPRIATLEFVLAFNRLFKAIRKKQEAETGTVQATWINIAFSFEGLNKLKPAGVNLNDFKDAAFKDGLLKRSQAGLLGDPVGSNKIGDPKNWLIGGPDREADVVLLLAADDLDSLNREVARVVTTIFPALDGGDQLVESGASILFRQDGATLTGPLRGHEHFGFLDGISQPGVRGKLPDGSFLTPNQNPLNVDQGKPGQDLLWPGEFVFGYPGQDANKDVADPGQDPLTNPARKAPEFARNGSFLVFRRLRQEVGTFHRFLQILAARFKLTPELVGARMVGRWASGAPTVVSPNQDDQALADDDCRNNNFEFDEDDPGDHPKSRPSATGDCPNVTEPLNDPAGQKAPFAAHIRKAYPRNDRSNSIPGLGESSTQTHRLLRRGIPYGVHSASNPGNPLDDGVDRGLLFLAYQVSIVDQFEFVTQNWVNNPDFKQNGVGHDPIIGQNAADPNRVRTFALNLPNEVQPITADQEWVIPTGGGYFFAPSIDTLQTLAQFAARRTAAHGQAPDKKPARKRK